MVCHERRQNAPGPLGRIGGATLIELLHKLHHRTVVDAARE